MLLSSYLVKMMHCRLHCKTLTSRGECSSLPATAPECLWGFCLCLPVLCVKLWVCAKLLSGNSLFSSCLSVEKGGVGRFVSVQSHGSSGFFFFFLMLWKNNMLAQILTGCCRVENTLRRDRDLCFMFTLQFSVFRGLDKFKPAKTCAFGLAL